MYKLFTYIYIIFVCIIILVTTSVRSKILQKRKLKPGSHSWWAGHRGGLTAESCSSALASLPRCVDYTREGVGRPRPLADSSEGRSLPPSLSGLSDPLRLGAGRLRHPLVLFLPLKRSKQNSERARDLPETAQQTVAEMGPSAGRRPSRGVGVESAFGDGGGGHWDCSTLPEQRPGRTHLPPAEPSLLRRRLPDKWAGPALEPAPLSPHWSCMGF